MNSEYLSLLVLFSLYHLSSPGSLISLFFDGRASSGLAWECHVLIESLFSTFSMDLVLPVRKHNKNGTNL